MRDQALQKIDWNKVDSSNVDATFFDEKTQTICVRFASGAVYTYIGASMDIYMSFIHAPSVGKYLHDVIKSFAYTRWDDEEALLKHLNH